MLCVKLDNFFSCVFTIWIFLCLTFFCIAWINKYHSIPLRVFLILIFKLFGYLSNLSFSWFLFRRARLSNLLRKAFASLLLVCGKLKNTNFGITLNFLQFNKKFISKFALFTLRDNFSNFLNLLIESTPPYSKCHK